MMDEQDPLEFFRRRLSLAPEVQRRAYKIMQARHAEEDRKLGIVIMRDFSMPSDEDIAQAQAELAKEAT